MVGIIVDEKVGLPRTEVLSPCADPIASCAYCEESGRCLVKSGELAEGLEQFLAERIALPPQINRFYMIWASPDDRLVSTLSFFSRQMQHRLEVTVFLTGPWAAEDVDDWAEKIAPFFPSADHGVAGKQPNLKSVWVIGNESTKRVPVRGNDRLSAARAVLGLLCSSGTAAAEALAFDSYQDGQPPWHVFGAFSLLPIPQDVRALQRSFAQGILKTGVEEELKRPDSEGARRSLLAKPRIDLEEILTFPLRGQCTEDVWPRLFSNVFEKWRCPLVLRSAEQRIEGTLARDFAELGKYVRTLQEELTTHSSSMRRESQAFISKRLEELEQWLLGQHSPSSIVLLLDHYFPEFAALDAQLGMRQKSPCTSSGDPGEDALKRQFVAEPKELFVRQGRRLFTLKELAIWLTSLLIAGGTAVWLWRSDCDWRVVAAAPLAFLFLFVIRTVVAMFAAARIKRELADQRRSRIRSLHEAFRQKIDRVKDLARRTIALQFVSRNRRIGDRLRGHFANFFGKWIAIDQLAEIPDMQSVAEELKRAGFSQSVIEAAKHAIEEVGSDLLNKSIQGNGQGIDLESIFGAFLKKSEISREAPPISQHVLIGQERLLEAWEGNDFPIGARLDPLQLQSGVFRLTFIPSDDRCDGFADDLQRVPVPITLNSSVFRSPVPAPVVFQIKAGLNAQELRNALEITRITK